MKEPIFTIEELTALGFQELDGDMLDDGGSYKWWAYNKNNNELHITYQFTNKSEFEVGYIEFNGEQLKGREITKKDVEFLMELM